MDIRSRKINKFVQDLEKLEKRHLAIHDSFARVKRLDASQNALRVVEQAIGGKLIEKKQKTGH